MKRILITSTAAAAVLVGAIMLVPGRAEASNARAKFRSMRSALHQLVASGELTVAATTKPGGGADIVVTLDGKPLPPDVPMTVTSEDHGDFVDYTVTINLSDNCFQSIELGKDANTLELVPKAAPTHRDVVMIDPKSARPIGWTTLEVANGKRKQISNVVFYDRHSNKTNYVFMPTGTSAETPNVEDTITVHLRIGKGGSATLSVKPTSH